MENFTTDTAYYNDSLIYMFGGSDDTTDTDANVTDSFDTDGETNGEFNPENMPGGFGGGRPPHGGPGGFGGGRPGQGGPGGFGGGRPPHGAPGMSDGEVSDATDAESGDTSTDETI